MPVRGAYGPPLKRWSSLYLLEPAGRRRWLDEARIKSCEMVQKTSVIFIILGFPLIPLDYCLVTAQCCCPAQLRAGSGE